MYITTKTVRAFEDYIRNTISYQELSDIVMEKEDIKHNGKGYRIFDWRSPLWFWEV
jgi:hypothetical protein